MTRKLSGQWPTPTWKEAKIDQAAPVQNTWYTVLDTTKDLVLYDMSERVNVADETLECRVTIDGTIYTSSTAAVAGTYYVAHFYMRSAGGYLSFGAGENNKAFLFQGRSIKVEVRKTTAAGAGNLTFGITYGKW